jgi:hypothetical protein
VEGILSEASGSTVATRVASFLPELAAANHELEMERDAGTLNERRLEIEASENGTDDEQYIEMVGEHRIKLLCQTPIDFGQNLGLGVLEERHGTSSSSESESSSDEQDDDAMDESGGDVKEDGAKETHVLSKLMGQRRPSAKGNKPKIEVVGDG